ncbi:unnamed protein product [Diamesa tonsa]
MTKKVIADQCKRNKLYATPRLNDVLYLHFQGFHKIENLEDYTGLKCLWLESNAISKIEGLDNQPLLKSLFLQNNLIATVENLDNCKELDTLVLSHNYIKDLDNISSEILPVLNTLNISHNQLKSIEGLEVLKQCHNISILDLSFNQIDDILVLKILGEMPMLHVLTLTGNPVVSTITNYRKTMVLECKFLTYLDSRPVFPRDRACAEAWKRGGFAEEKKEHDSWNKEERRKIRRSVNALLSKRSNGHQALLESSDEEDNVKKPTKKAIQNIGAQPDDANFESIDYQYTHLPDIGHETFAEDHSNGPESIQNPEDLNKVLELCQEQKKDTMQLCFLNDNEKLMQIYDEAVEQRLIQESNTQQLAEIKNLCEEEDEEEEACGVNESGTSTPDMSGILTVTRLEISDDITESEEISMEFTHFEMSESQRAAECIIEGLISLVAAQSSSKYSLQNMPRTSFTCRDKILGGYYADSETNCQMFHICVKVAGVGIQDFRFLCPNNTAFDQEAQICADWGDVDCESATLYYGSDNFDLYRIGSTFESKRAPFAEEDESVFHLQRAETSDARRSKQYIVNQNNQNNLQHNPQKQHSVQPPRPTTTFTPPTQKQTTVSTTTLRPAFEQTRVIAASTYRPSVAPKSTFAEKTTAAYKVSNNNNSNNNNNNFFKHQKTSDVNDDEILKESQSAHFYNNRNNGKEDFDEDYSRSTKAPALPAKQKLRGRQRGRSKFRALQASNNNFQSTAASTPSSSTTESSQFVPQYSRTNNPINQRQNEQKPQAQAQQQSKDFSKSTPQKFNFKTQKYESAEPLHPTTQFYNPNYETKGTDSNFGNLELTKNNNKTFATRQLTTSSLDDVNRPTTFNPQQFYQNQQYQQPQQSQQQLPRGFSAAQKSTQAPQTQQSQTTPQQPKRKTPQPDSRYQTIARTEGRDQHTPSSHKKFSTLVPKENYNPTTFKPSTYSKKPVDHIASQKLEKQQQQNNQQQQQNLQNRQSNFFSSTTTARPLAENEEDDGQYRPELYEKDFYRNKAKTSKAPAVPRGSINNNNNNNYNNFFQTTTTTTTLRPFNQNNNNNNHNSNHYNSAEDEFLKTAHSQNIAASGNELRAEKERARQQAKFNDYTTTVNEKSSPRPFSKPTTTPSTTTISHRAVTTSRPSKKVEKDVSYDYQYYDTHNENNDYTEYGAAEDFGKTSKKSN